MMTKHFAIGTLEKWPLICRRELYLTFKFKLKTWQKLLIFGITEKDLRNIIEKKEWFFLKEGLLHLNVEDYI